MRPIVLAVAGSDPTAGAGIQADLKAIEAAGAYAATVITAITAQNTRGVRKVRVLPASWVAEQLDAVLDDLEVAAIKIGMLGTARIVRAVGAATDRLPCVPLVLDPVLHASDGCELLAASAVPELLARLVPRATLITPNASEAERLTGIAVRSLADAARAGRRLIDLGARAVLITGGHLAGAERGSDLLVTAQTTHVFAGRWITTRHTHGTGCTLASAIAAGLGRGMSLDSAIISAKRLVEEALRLGWAIGGGQGPTDPLAVLGRGSQLDAPS